MNRQRFATRWATLVLITATAACGGEPDGSEAVRERLGDTLVVENRTPRHNAPRLQAVARYGSLDDAGPATLVEVMAMTAGPDGSVVLYDNGEGIKRFAPSGEFAGWVARLGAGPGEVRHTTSLAVGPAGEVAALDLGNRRVLIVEPNGDSRSFRLPDGQPRYHEDALHYAADGTLRVGINPPFTPEGTEPTPRLAYQMLEPAAGFADSVLVPARIWQRCPTRSESRYRVGFWEDQREPYLPKAVWALAPDGSFAIGCPDRYEFDVQTPGGSVVRVRRPGAQPVRLESEMQQFLARWVSLPALPSQRPAYARLIVPGDGRVWVWPNQPAERWTPPAGVRARSGVTEAWRLSSRGAFDVFDENGSWLGTVPLPDELAYSGFPTERPVHIRGDTLWGVTRDSLGVNYVTRYVVRWR